MIHSDERSIRERMDGGELVRITARTFPGGLVLDPQRTLDQNDKVRAHSAIKFGLNQPAWGFHAKDVDTGDSVFALADGEKANISFGLAAFKSGAFNPVYLDAFEFEE